MFQRAVVRCLLATAIMGCAVAAHAVVSIDTVVVGNAGNTGEWSGESYGPDRICGAVSYAYNIGKYEVTAGQYSGFLNAVAKTDAYGLYNASMYSSSYGCKIRQSGSAGSYTYLVDANGDGVEDAGWINRPVNHVSWGDAARFANWLRNGQPTTGVQDSTTTEDGSYYLNGATSDVALMAVTRKAGATWVIPTEDEWYKAAYHKNDGATGNYWDYPTSSNTTPSNDLVEPTDPGNNATFYDYGCTIDSPYYRTEVGAHENSESPYLTFDQGGNLWEWNETEIDAGSSRGLRGGDWYHDSDELLASYRYNYGYPTSEGTYGGFRVASVPEPGSLAMLLGIALTALLRYWRKRV